MDFLMDAFERVISQYKYKFKLIKNNKTYTLSLFDLPPELDYKLICLQYDKPPIQTTKKEGHQIIPITKKVKENICRPVRENGVNTIRVDFNEDDYAIKINKIEFTLKRYWAKSSKGYV